MSRKLLPGLALIALLVFAASAFGHAERPSYWPDPAADTSVKPAAGGAVPKIRSLRSSLNRKAVGTTRVVCQKNSLSLLRSAIRKARREGYLIRPSDRRGFNAGQAKRLLAINKRLFKMCKFREIQPAVTKSKNNDRVVVMPGLYEEPTARAQPTNDEKCKDYRTNGDKPGEEGTALSYEYQYHCPNDQNLIAVIGREPAGKAPVPPRWDRHGIPDVGKCIRCNFQIEGSGVSADDVIVEAGDASKGNEGPNGAGSKKDVGIRADRADGFVLRRMTFRHAGEHGIYVHEVDGFMLDQFKAYYNRLYGTLVFTPDHGVQQNCDAVGHGDSGVYPGAALESGVQRPPGTRFRYSQEVRNCDLHGNLAGWSGTNGNAVWTHHNNFYNNALGLQTDVVTGAGHPGYPGDSSLIEDNNFYSNNFNPYAPESQVKPAFPFPVGTGMWIAGGNHHRVRNNRFWDNWRRGTMIFSVPDAIACGPGPTGEGNEQAGCDNTKISTSHYNQTHDNIMGQDPNGKTDRNGVDFWWDNGSGARGNCWYRNSGPLPITTDPQQGLPDCDDGKDPAMSLGTGDPENEGELGGCASAFVTRDFENSPACVWLRPPSDPGNGDGAMAEGQSKPLVPFRVARASAAPPRENVPLGQLNCGDWNAAMSDEARTELLGRLTAFLGGPVGDGTTYFGTGSLLTNEQARNLYDNWCRYEFADGFLLYKLYSFTSALTR